MISSTLAYSNILKLHEKYEDIVSKMEQIKKSASIDLDAVCKNMIVIYNDGIDVSMNMLTLIDTVRKNLNEENVKLLADLVLKLKDSYLYVSTSFADAVLSFLSKLKSASNVYNKISYNKLIGKKSSVLKPIVISTISSDDINSKEVAERTSKLVNMCKFILLLQEEMNKLEELKEEHIISDMDLISNIISDTYDNIQDMLKTNKRIKKDIC